MTCLLLHSIFQSLRIMHAHTHTSTQNQQNRSLVVQLIGFLVWIFFFVFQKSNCKYIFRCAIHIVILRLIFVWNRFAAPIFHQMPFISIVSRIYYTYFVPPFEHQLFAHSSVDTHCCTWIRICIAAQSKCSASLSGACITFDNKLIETNFSSTQKQERTGKKNVFRFFSSSSVLMIPKK